MQTGYQGNPQLQQNPQFQPQNPQFQPQIPQFQPQQQFQSGGLGPQGRGAGFFTSQPTGFMAGNLQQQNRPPPPPVPSIPPVPPMPSQFTQPNIRGNFLNYPPPQQPNNNILTAQPTGYVTRPLIAQPTGIVDPRLQMMAQTFMPMNPSSYGASTVPQLPPQQQNLVSSMAQHNQEQRGAPTQQLSWALTKAEKKKYNDIFRSWDTQNKGFIDGQTALSLFGASGLPQIDLARIW